ncbi:MAG: imidazole glycerol phosphate synthase subunit HisH, partial [Chthoniobacterales bacterium]
IAQDRPYLGICLGYQLLFESSEESPGVSGLGVLPGIVRRFPAGNPQHPAGNPQDSAGALKVPHMGWNTLDIRQPADRLYAGLPGSPGVYFVHSYFPVPADGSIVTATCDYAGPFAASVTRGALSAVQFHPEKSQRTGLAILRNFVTAIQNSKSEIQNRDASAACH